MKSAAKQYTINLKTLVWTYLPPTLIIIFLTINRLVTNIPTHVLTWDVAFLLSVPVFVGIVSTIGILLWTASAAVWFFSFLLFKKLDLRSRWFFFWSGILTVILLLDDWLMLHVFVPDYLGISKKSFLIMYGLLFMMYIIFYFNRIKETPYLLFFMSIFFFLLSAVVDSSPVQFFAYTVIEDGAKLLGIVSWLSYAINTCIKAVPYTSSDFA